MWSFIKNLKDIIKFMIVVTLIGLIIGTIATGVELVYYQFNPKEDKVEKKAQDDIPKQVEGYLKAGALWVDKNNLVHRNLESVKVEIIEGKIVMANGGEAKPFEFLEGENIGVWGYTSENSFTVNPKTASASKSAGIERIIRASPQRSCTCVVNVEDIDTVVDAAKLKDELLYGLFVNLGTVIIVREDTRVSCYFSESYRGYVPVIFLEGKYEGREVYVPEKRLQEQ